MRIQLSQGNTQSYQRTLFLYQDEKEVFNVLIKFLKHYTEPKSSNLAGIIVIDDKIPPSSLFRDLNRKITSLNNVSRITFNEVSTVLGCTVDFLFIDLREEFSPNRVNILLETVRGGGLIFILGLPYSEWVYSVNKEQIFLRKKQLNKAKITKSVLLNWFLENIHQNPQCITNGSNLSEIIARFNPMPYSINLKDQVNDFFVTTEQKDVINGIIETILDSKHPNSCSILLANRGRGKSASIGLAISLMLSKRGMQSFNVVISSPHPTNAQTLFEFLSRGLTSENIEFRLIKREGMVTEIRTSFKVKITYLWPDEINKSLKANLLVVDEAAAIPVAILKKMTRIEAKKIFISTIHGYEGAGRGFQHKFLRYLRAQKIIHYTEFTLDQPIRYLQGDSIEKLLNNSFLLDVELKPSEIEDKGIAKDSIRLQEYKNPEYLFSNKGIPYLRQLFGLLIYAHYRNQPNDLLLLADSDKHFLVGIYGTDNQKNNLLLASSQLANEGLMAEQEILRVTSGRFIKGNLIPTIAIRHFSKKFAKLHGLRIVRIATHPSLINKGYGRIAIELQDQIFSSYDWTGVSYGATEKLMKFWRKFGFKAVHIRPIKTPGTGEWNIVLINPLSPSAVAIVNQASTDFLLQFLALLKQSLHSMIPELIIQILETCSLIPDYKLKITSGGRFRLKNYLNGTINFLLAIDAIYELAMKYFVTPKTFKLSPSQEALLISRILQGRTWGQTLGRTGLNWQTANGLLEKAITKLSQEYL